MKNRTPLTILTLLICGLAARTLLAGIVINPYVFTDTTPPTPVTATFGTSGESLTIVWSENVNHQDDVQFTLTQAGNATKLVYVKGDGTTALVYTPIDKLATPVIITNDLLEILLESAGNSVRDLKRNPDVAFGSFLVINSSTIAP